MSGRRPYRETLHARVTLTAVALALAGLMLAISADVAGREREQARAAAWPEAPARVTQVEVRLAGKVGAPVYRVEPRYEWQHGGVRREGRTLWPGYRGHLDVAEADALAAELRGRHTARVSPEDPTRASLLPPPAPGRAARGFFAFWLGFAGLVPLAVWLWPSPRQDSVPALPERPPPVGPAPSPWRARVATFTVWLLLIAVPLGGFAAGSAWLSFRSLRALTLGTLWSGDHVAVPCRVIAVREVELDTIGDSNQVTFAYQVPELGSLRGNALGPGRELSGPAYDLTRGDLADCYYPRGDPRRAFLATGLRRSDAALAAAGLVLCPAFLAGLLRATRRTLRAHRA